MSEVVLGEEVARKPILSDQGMNRKKKLCLAVQTANTRVFAESVFRSAIRNPQRIATVVIRPKKGASTFSPLRGGFTSKGPGRTTKGVEEIQGEILTFGEKKEGKYAWRTCTYFLSLTWDHFSLFCSERALAFFLIPLEAFFSGEESSEGKGEASCKFESSWHFSGKRSRDSKCDFAPKLDLYKSLRSLSG